MPLELSLFVRNIYSGKDCSICCCCCWFFYFSFKRKALFIKSQRFCPQGFIEYLTAVPTEPQSCWLYIPIYDEQRNITSQWQTAGSLCSTLHARCNSMCITPRLQLWGQLPIAFLYLGSLLYWKQLLCCSSGCTLHTYFVLFIAGVTGALAWWTSLVDKLTQWPQ